VSSGLSNKMGITTQHEITISPEQLAADIERDCTPDFKVELVRELLRLDRALAAEVGPKPGSILTCMQHGVQGCWCLSVPPGWQQPL
jgi:hypothetical protein